MPERIAGSPKLFTSDGAINLIWLHAKLLFPTGGAEGKGAINALLKLVQGASEPSAPGTFAKKKGKGSQPLNRPLIAICNDLYAPALRPLRNVARLIAFKQTQVICSCLLYVGQALSRPIARTVSLCVDGKKPALQQNCQEPAPDGTTILIMRSLLAERQACRALETYCCKRKAPD